MIDLFATEYGWSKKDTYQLTLVEINQLAQKINERRRRQNQANRGR
jgi:hypothetical protein